MCFTIQICAQHGSHNENIPRKVAPKFNWALSGGSFSRLTFQVRRRTCLGDAPLKHGDWCRGCGMKTSQAPTEGDSTHWRNPPVPPLHLEEPQELLYAMKTAGVNLGALPPQCETHSLIQALNMDTSCQLRTPDL